MHVKDVRTLEDLLSVALRLEYNEPTRSYWPSLKRERKFEPHHHKGLDYTYNVNRGVVIVRMPEAIFVAPLPWLDDDEDEPKIEKWIDLGSLRRVKLFVPFSNGDYPVEYESFWNNLQEQAWEARGF